MGISICTAQCASVLVCSSSAAADAAAAENDVEDDDDGDGGGSDSANDATVAAADAWPESASHTHGPCRLQCRRRRLCRSVEWKLAQCRSCLLRRRRRRRRRCRRVADLSRPSWSCSDDSGTRFSPGSATSSNSWRTSRAPARSSTSTC